MFTKKVANPHWIQWMSNRCPHTPDIAALEDSAFQLVFACDDLMYAGKSYDLIREHSTNECRGFSQHKLNFYYHREAKMGVPVVGKKSSANQPLRIKGEVHKVFSNRLVELDNRYRNGVCFHRVRVPILVPWRDHELIRNQSTDGRQLPPVLAGIKHKLGPEQLHVLEAWMYVGKTSFWMDKLDNGFETPQVPIYEPKEDKPWLTRYYKFPKDERFFENN